MRRGLKVGVIWILLLGDGRVYGGNLGLVKSSYSVKFCPTSVFRLKPKSGRRRRRYQK
ncbi:unnamed protein product [Rhodiola kirilowii]